MLPPIPLRAWLGVGLLFVGTVQATQTWPREPQSDTPKTKGNAAVSATVPESSSRGKSKASINRPAPAPSTDSASAAMLPQYDKNTYRIGIEDELQISVWREPEISLPVAVRPDGMITLPLLNDIRVVGLTTLELQALLTEKLKAFVTEPQVTVIPRVIRSRKVYLVGEAGRQGAYSLNGNMTVLQLIAEAGGLGPFAKAGSIYILRTVNGQQIRIPFNYKRAIRGEGSQHAVFLLPGDTVVVP